MEIRKIKGVPEFVLVSLEISSEFSELKECALDEWVDWWLERIPFRLPWYIERFTGVDYVDVCASDALPGYQHTDGRCSHTHRFCRPVHPLFVPCASSSRVRREQVRCI
jgi:hypothetical protein